MLEKLKSKLPPLRLNPTKFYTIGVWCFGIVAIMNTANFIQNFLNAQNINYFLLIGSGASLVFNYALWGFFYYLKSNTPPENLDQASIAEMEEILKKEVLKDERV